MKYNLYFYDRNRKMYKNVGFEIVDENEEEYIMVCEL